MKPTFLLLAVAAIPALAAPAFADSAQFDGQWASIACELRPQQGQSGLEPWHLKRDITIAEGTIFAVFHSFADSNCTMPLYDLEFSGQFNDVGASSVAQGARDIDLVIDQSVKLTPYMEPFAQFLNSGGAGSCGAEAFGLGMTQEVRGTGCAAIGLPANAITLEFETMLVKGDALFFGARPVDGSSPSAATQRPTALQMPLYRK